MKVRLQKCFILTVAGWFAAAPAYAQSALDSFAQQDRDGNEEAIADSAWREGRKIESEVKEATKEELERDLVRLKARTPAPSPTPTGTIDPSYRKIEAEIDHLEKEK